MSGPFSTQTPPIKRPIVYGSTSAQIGPDDTPPNDPTHSHRWTIYLRGLHGEDISYFIEKVEFKLHESFASPVRVYRQPPYEVTETGWGEFAVGITIWFIDAKEKPLNLTHLLQLYHKDNNPLDLKRVVSEHYDEIEFNTPGLDLMDALNSHLWDPLPKPTPNETFDEASQEKELKMLQNGLEKILAEYEKIKLTLPDLEHELREAYDQLKVTQ